MQKFNSAHVESLPPFQGGAAGLLSYELSGTWESLPNAKNDEFQLPALAVGIYDWVIAWDHLDDRAWIISHGNPDLGRDQQIDRAAARIEWVQSLLSGAKNNVATKSIGEVNPHSVIDATSLVQQWAAPGLDGLTTNFHRDAYLQAVQKAIDYIYAGDIFQVNLSQRLLYPAKERPIEIYGRLRERNAAPFGAYFQHDDWAVLSASPERFVAVHDGEVETRPIKGTRQRRTIPEADLYTRDELRESEKDQAENVMIVDLLRNDLSKVCRPGTVHVPALCSVESYETVQHLVSEIRAKLETQRNSWDVLEALFPGGSITGAPKVRAMQIIAELEPTRRGAYCGSLFYLGFSGHMDSSILIRTLTHRRGWIQCQVGGGIVAQSDPQLEYEETMHKAEGMLRSLEA
jgi:para-aminobenzoate synthetase component 1